MNATVHFTVLILVICLHLQNGMAWRRRRRVRYGLHKRQIEQRQGADVEQPPSMDKFCALHGEYVVKNGRLMPCDVSGVLVDGLKCNKNLCRKGAFCWQCRLRDGTGRFESISLDKLSDVICEDVQCLYGKKDTGLEYYTANGTRSIPLSKGPFTCSSYLCMSDNKCWKCRLHEEIEQFQVIRKGEEFDNRVSCCPIPKTLFSVANTNGGYFEPGTSRSMKFMEKFDAYLEPDEELKPKESPSIVIDFSKPKLIVGIVLIQKGDTSHFSVAYSKDGKGWQVYREYSRTAVFKSSPAPNTNQRTLFKPLLARYLRIKPFNDELPFNVSVSISGCDILSSD